MAQGLIKKPKSGNNTSAKPKRPSALGPKPGPRQIAPKKNSLVKQRKMTKKITAGYTAKTEQNLAAKAGHLELLAGGKKDKDKKGKKN